MNIHDYEVLRTLLIDGYTNQRILSELSGYSLGVVNKSIKNLVTEGFLDENQHLTNKAILFHRERAPRNAIILAAGQGMRTVPINFSTPKAFLEVNGESLIERQIKQLHEVGIKDITIVVGFMKEKFDFLIDEYDVDLVVNSEYARKNNLFSLSLVADRISNTYIIPSDIWCAKNPFNNHEMYSWYMVTDQISESDVRINRKMELVKVGENNIGNKMIGIAYILERDSVLLRQEIKKAVTDPDHDHDFWENMLYKGNKMTVFARELNDSEVREINTYEELREFDSNSSHLKSDVLETIARELHVTINEIENISILKKGMTNRSFLFSVHNNKYIMRVPGEGTDKLINRSQEAEVYKVISGYKLCDDPIYINPKNGYKITRYLNGVRVCDPDNLEDLEKCMSKLRWFHQLKLKVNHTFDIIGQILFYEKLWKGEPSIYKDYEKTKSDVLSLWPYVDSTEKDWCLTHIDAVPDNFLFYVQEEKTEQTSNEELQLTDWEYAGMQDPHVDIAMFCIYSLYDKDQVDRLIDIYFQDKCSQQIRAKIYVYIAACGLLWSNWCEFKRNLGVEFGEYSLRQYRYSKDYYKYATALIYEIGSISLRGENEN